MLCHDVKRVVYFLLDDSLGDNKRRNVESHLHDCPDCEVRVVVQRRLRVFVRRRLAPVAAPESLRIRLSQTLRSISAE